MAKRFKLYRNAPLPEEPPPPPSSIVDGYEMPDLNDEKATYTLWGWSWSAPQDSAVITDPYTAPPYIAFDPGIHFDTEGDDLWTYIMMYRRTGNSIYENRANAWARYYKEDYRTSVGASGDTYNYDKGNYGLDHFYGWGLLTKYEHDSDTDALAEAEALADELAFMHSPSTSFGCLITHGCVYYGTRQIGRHLLFATRLAQVTGSAEYIALRDLVLSHLLNPTAETLWDETEGTYFVGEFGTDAALGAGAHAAGSRINSPFGIAVLCEAMFKTYLETGNTELRDKLISMAYYTANRGLDPVYQYSGSVFGIHNGETYHNYAHYEYLNSTFVVKSDGADTRQITLHGYDASNQAISENITLNGTTGVAGITTFARLSKITGASNASRTVTVYMPDGTTPVSRSFGVNFTLPINTTTSSIVTFWDPNYATASVNVLVIGYKLTGDTDLLDAAKVFFNRGTKGIYGSLTARQAADNAVGHFIDTEFASAASYFFLDHNKGELAYTYLIFENGGLPSVIGGEDIGELADNMNPGTWAELTTANMVPTFTNTNGSTGIINPYAMLMVRDSTDECSYFLGSDHGGRDAPGADHTLATYRFVKFDETTGAWSILDCPPFVSITADPPVYTDAHGYGLTALNVAGRRLYRMPYNSAVVNVYDLDGETWDTLPANPVEGPQVINAICFFPERNALIHVSSSSNIWEFREATQTWHNITPPGLSFDFVNTWTWAIYHPTLGEVYVGSSNGNHWKYNIAGTWTQLTDIPALYSTYSGGGDNGQWVPEPVSGKFLVMTHRSNGTGRNMYLFDPATQTFSDLAPLPVKHLGANENWTAVAVPEHGVTMFCWVTGNLTPENRDAGVYLYRHL